MKYVKKPIVVEAFQFGVDEEPEWFVDEDGIHVVFHDDYPNCCKIITLGGVMEAWTGDMIVKGVHGDFYSYKKDIFDATYDLVEDEKPWKYPVIGSEHEK